MWGYYWGYTAAQIELMAIDQPIVVYNREKKKGSKAEHKKSSALDILRAQQKWEERQNNAPKDGGSIRLDFGEFMQPKNTNT